MDEKANEPRMRSVNSTRQSFVRFFNLSPKKVDIIWINYEGVGVTYKTLAPHEFFDISTWVSHPWIFRDNVTKDTMAVFSCDSRYARSVFLPSESMNKRKLVFITLPIYSLKERCFQVFRDLHINATNVFSLELPRILQHEYVHFLNNGGRTDG
ncbi:von Hippel-Lindau disease tumor suppressor-like protein [Dinothrombium tinctorium]|uniref:von Hippel-Lindau disease tumor suppressor-like protein n=1 Tax=Dinothrombium tinctorium TaxID=1965070 RepID=A0A3S3PFN5_9ACAR|nr:von Hippel-Lindau disease tumor suppressor-like protein [Dinothrombium tinctorium]